MWTDSLEQSLRLLLKNSRKSVFAGLNLSNTEAWIDWKLACLDWKALGLALEALFLAAGETRIASLQCLASQCEAVVAQSTLASLDEAKLPT